MASNSFLQQLSDLDFTNEEQDMVFTPTFQWDSTTDDSNLLIIGKLVSSRAIDDLAVILGMISSLGVLGLLRTRGWLMLCSTQVSILMSILFNSMNIWVRIYSIPSVFRDDDNIAHQIGDSFGAMIGKVIKIGTHRIDLNMVDYLRVGIILDVTKPIRRCVAIGGNSSTLKICPLQYERLPLLCYRCGIIGHSLDLCATFKSSNSTKLQYGDWLCYIPTKRGKSSEPSKTAAATKEFGHTFQQINPFNPDTTTNKVVDKADVFTTEVVDDAVAAVEEGVTLPTTPNGSPVTMHTNGNATLPLATAPTQDVTIKTSPILDNDMGTNNTIPPTQAFRGNKRRSSMPDKSMTKRPHPQMSKLGLAAENSPEEVEIQPHRGK
ncbi:hypothetical protein V6N11_083990 [Hibiscus sabdariffa]|uniref:Zinc knuckle CX2CX4HX4C domain-containing protein n=1 Tax=Hibiscus sabdariffa TaxID=183260 RepID=A0ABR2QD60_9ROSI